MTGTPQLGDSGGIVYALNKESNIRYTIGIISGRITFDGLVKPDLYPGVVYGICCKASLINNTFGIERY